MGKELTFKKVPPHPHKVFRSFFLENKTIAPDV